MPLHDFTHTGSFAIMPIMIGKFCTDAQRFLRGYGYYPRARDAFSSVLRFHGIGAGDRVLLPAYIGWSPREGSGVFDPITENGITPVFYHMDRQLHIDEADAEMHIRSDSVKAILFIHYFGFVDPAFFRLAALAKDAGILVIEDAAHALLTDMVGGLCGRTGDYTLYSLHKLLPFQSGGMLTANFGRPLPPDAARQSAFGDPFAYDLFGASQTILRNYHALAALLPALSGEITPLWPQLPDGVIPQTFPAIVEHFDRFQLYLTLNDAGFGAVGLYHTMIEPLRGEGFEASHFLAKHMINFPVHQDADPTDYAEMLRITADCIRR